MPEPYQRSLGDRCALSRLADVAGFWTLDRRTITGRSAVILRQHTTPFRPMIVPFDDLELVYQSLRKLEPPTYAQISARQCAGTLNWANSTLGREIFFKAAPRGPPGDEIAYRVSWIDGREHRGVLRNAPEVRGLR